MAQSFSRVRAIILAATVFTVAAICAVLWDTPQAAQDRNYLPEKFAVADVVTLTIRDRSTRVFAVRTDEETDREDAERAGQIMADYGSFVLVAAGGSTKAKADWQKVEPTIHLPGASFDPLADRTAESKVPTERGYYIVQFGVTPTDELIESLTS
jgi:hypothetical protein